MSENKYLVLIVDDNQQNLQIIADLLSRSGIEIALAKSGLQAIEFIRNETPDLILLDIMMPEMDGFKTCKILKGFENARHVPVIFLTAKTEKEDVVKGFELGAVDYITKPFNLKELLSRVFTHLELKRSRETIRVQNETLREQNEELTVLNATKDRFFSIISHDLRNPFNTFKKSLEFLNGNYDSLNENTMKDFLSELDKSASNLNELLGDLLNWSKIQIGNYKFIPSVADLATLIDQSLSFHDTYIKSKKIEILLNIMDASIAFCDTVMIYDVLNYILSNAIKFTENGGKVSISTYRTNNKITINISDTGIGIKPGDIDNLFHLDKQKIKLGTNGEVGTGLGLIISKALLDINNGGIDVRSNSDKGTSFLIHLPYGE